MAPLSDRQLPLLPADCGCRLINSRAVKTPDSSDEIVRSHEASRETLREDVSSTRSADIAAQDQTVRANVSANRARASAALLAGQRWRRAARWIGLAVFLFGALLLVYVFRQALDNFQNFSRPGYLTMRINMTGGNTDWGQQITAYVSVLGSEILKFLYLLLLGVVGSFISSKGIQFFAASESVIDEAITPYED
ncbi:MAG TPA: hypothetical protein VM821_06020 [Abditibacteriaceae bacterium]|jgi:hypothetical protein|nr:hypothetical protein [Abditibacteriaceae bacterium]